MCMLACAQLALVAVNGLAQNVNITCLAVPVYFLVGLRPGELAYSPDCGVTLLL